MIFLRAKAIENPRRLSAEFQTARPVKIG